jgi:hypothetical protein
MVDQVRAARLLCAGLYAAPAGAGSDAGRARSLGPPWPPAAGSDALAIVAAVVGGAAAVALG